MIDSALLWAEMRFRNTAGLSTAGVRASRESLRNSGPVTR